MRQFTIIKHMRFTKCACFIKVSTYKYEGKRHRKHFRTIGIILGKGKEMVFKTTDRVAGIAEMSIIANFMRKEAKGLITWYEVEV